YYSFGKSMTTGNTYPTTSSNRWKYNGKETQTTGEVNWLDYGARMYDEVIGRWIKPDPMSEKYFFQSPYVYVRNSPIVYVDPTGMYIEESSQQEWERRKGDVTSRKDYLQNRINKLTAKAKVKGWSAEKLANKIGDKSERISSLNNSLDVMESLENSSQGYSLSHAGAGENGGVSLNTVTNIIDISFGKENTGNFVHEMTHAGQFETGDIAFDSKTGNTLAQDIYDEISAYKAQFAYDPSSVSDLSSTSVANSFGTINASWVQGLVGGNIYVPIGSPNFIPGVSTNTGAGPLNINSTKTDFINAYPNYPSFNTLPVNYVLKNSYPNIYYKK
ncbi:MAG: RHS repeat-associated core domain-containing protein, partial [Bacteroidales bacterium]